MSKGMEISRVFGLEIVTLNPGCMSDSPGRS